MKDRSFTVVFSGDIRKFAKNPLFVETEFGTPCAVGVGDAFEQICALEELMEKAICQIKDGSYQEAINTLREQV